jgi:hypothetical protein
MKPCYLHRALFVLSLPSLAQGQYSTYNACQLGQLPIVLLSRDRATRNFTVVKRLDASEKNLTEGQFRMLEASDVYSGNVRASFIPGLLAEGITMDIRSLEENVFTNTTDDAWNTTGELFYARECSCHEPEAPTVYCPFAIKTCLSPSRWDPDQIPGCRNIPQGQDVKSYALLLSSVWFICLLSCLVCTNMGPSIFNFCLSRCIPGWTEYVVDRIIRRNPERARHMYRLLLVRQHLALEQAMELHRNEAVNEQQDEAPSFESECKDPVQPPTSLSLRSKKYRAEKCEKALGSGQDNDSETDAIDCTICFATLIDGDRVGSLPCDHLFHVECLKMWLPRRNVCPLCQTADIATPRYDAPGMETEESTD